MMNDNKSCKFGSVSCAAENTLSAPLQVKEEGQSAPHVAVRARHKSVSRSNQPTNQRQEEEEKLNELPVIKQFYSCQKCRRFFLRQDMILTLWLALAAWLLTWIRHLWRRRPWRHLPGVPSWASLPVLGHVHVMGSAVGDPRRFMDDMRKK